MSARVFTVHASNAAYLQRGDAFRFYDGPQWRTGIIVARDPKALTVTVCVLDADAVHDHGLDPSCHETLVDGQLRGECVIRASNYDDATRLGAIERDTLSIHCNYSVGPELFTVTLHRFDDSETWGKCVTIPSSAPSRCTHCGRRWVAIYPPLTPELECPTCHRMTPAPTTEPIDEQ